MGRTTKAILIVLFSLAGACGTVSRHNADSGPGGPDGATSDGPATADAPGTIDSRPAVDADTSCHSPADCNDGDVCTTDTCRADGTCNHAPIPVDDGDNCTVDACDPALGPTHAAVDCGAFSGPCLLGVCNPADGTCSGMQVNQGLACEDGLPCTSGELCNAGVCGGAPPPSAIYFTDDFSAGFSTWTLDPEWAIGPAVASMPSPPFTTGDPAMDHSPSADNRVAGLVIGGDASTTIHMPEYLTSPIIDLSGATGNVFLSFWRQLNADYPPFMTSTVEVYDGATWQTVFSAGPSTTIDAGWTYEQYDVTPYKNAQFRVRFGESIGNAGVYVSPSWSIDDVMLSAETCDAMGGSCTTAVQKDCSAAGDQCHAGVCDAATGACVPVPVTDGTFCEDGNACTSSDSCQMGACAAGPPTICPAAQCNTVTCDPVAGCVYNPLPNGTMCDDGNPCTVNDNCQFGGCSGSVPALVEDFSDNFASWTLDTSWQIGSATASSVVGAYGNQDPGTDTTPTADNGVAGVVIGGAAPATVHGFYFLTSPPMNTAVISGSVELKFRRWLNSQGSAFMHNKVEVFDGTTWQTLIDYGTSAVTDSAWASITVAIPDAWKNANMQIRFGYDRSSGALPATSWNLDDVRVEPVGYPILMCP